MYDALEAEWSIFRPMIDCRSQRKKMANEHFSSVAFRGGKAVHNFQA